MVLLLIVAASRWLVADTHPDAAPSLISAAFGCGWAAVLIFVVFSRSSISSRASSLRTFAAGAMLFGGPAIGLILRAHELTAGALTIALALTPVAVAIGASAFGPASSGGIAGRIWPGLAAVTGLLLILVQPELGNTRSDIALILAPILTGLGAALYDFSPADPIPASATPAIALFGAAALFTLSAAAAFLITGHFPHLSLLAIAYEGVLSLLSILALARLGATRWSSQFTWLPLLILLEGILLVRPPVTARWLTGLALLAIASIYLLLPQVDDPDSSPTLLPTSPAQD